MKEQDTQQLAENRLIQAMHELNLACRLLGHPVSIKMHQLADGMIEATVVGADTFNYTYRFPSTTDTWELADEMVSVRLSQAVVGKRTGTGYRWREGDRVRATQMVVDGPDLVAGVGAIGTVEHVEDGYAPTVRFDMTGRAYGTYKIRKVEEP